MAKKDERREIKTPGGSTLAGIAEIGRERNAPESGGQSGDTQGLSDRAEADSESVRELVEEGQSFEAALISGIENAPDPDVSEIRTKEAPEDDVPPEYFKREQD